tara:strand:+ start:10545 stop:11117 length:573 start_codon:yes stop_codon:yes gene_type:complete
VPEYSNIIDVPAAFANIKDYVVIKKSAHFPNYHDFDDIDIFCKDRDLFVQQLEENLSNLGLPAYRLNTTVKQNNTHIDVWFEFSSNLNLRFDIYDRFPYSKFLTSAAYYDDIINNFVEEEYSGILVRIPPPLDDMVIRFFEWIEHPNKKKHFDFVNTQHERHAELEEIVLEYSTVPYHYVAQLETPSAPE